MIVLVHVDDCTIAATSIILIDRFKAEISKHVEITDLGDLHWLLGIEIARNAPFTCPNDPTSTQSFVDITFRI
jgi:hypothetical protein